MKEAVKQQIYFITAGSYVKIGTSCNVEERLASIRTSNAEDARLAESFLGGHKLEKALHALFKSHHVRGEWFHREILKLRGAEPSESWRRVVKWGAKSKTKRFSLAVSDADWYRRWDRAELPSLDDVPDLDHMSLWNHLHRGCPVLVHQPYMAKPGCLDRARDFAQKNHLKVCMDPGLSWHNPGLTVLIAYWR